MTQLRLERYLTIFAFCLFCASPTVRAEAGMAFSTGEGILSIVPYRFSFSWDFGPFWQPNVGWGLRVILESSVGYWDGPARSDLARHRPRSLTVATLGPMFRWQRDCPLGQSTLTPYAELGVSPSWLSEKEIQGRILSLHFQFEDKIGVGMRFGQKQQYDVSIRAYHYSNASIKRPNSGVNLAMVSFGIWFPNT